MAIAEGKALNKGERRKSCEDNLAARVYFSEYDSSSDYIPLLI